MKLLHRFTVVFLIFTFLHNTTTAFTASVVQPSHLSVSRGQCRKNQCLFVSTCDQLTVTTSKQAQTGVASLGDIHRHTLLALRHRNNEDGLQSLHALAELCQRRIPHDCKDDQHDEDRIIHHLPQLLSESVTNEIAYRLESMAEKGWLMTNPDSVDGLPSFHLNLISDGENVVSDGETDLDDFQHDLRELIQLVAPHVYGNLLPRAQKLLHSSSVKVGDVFLRRYGQDIMDGQSRNGISAHYDVYAGLTAVCALDDAAAEGNNGLYTTATMKRDVSISMGTTSNHAALRRYFPLKKGDAVLHSWNVLHGVNVERGIDRTSLVVWFTSDEESSAPMPNELKAPWLTNRDDVDTNDVVQFVLASALESSSPNPSVACEGMSSQDAATASINPVDLYFKSACSGNAFALTRLGSLCEEGNLSPSMITRISDLLDQLQETHNDIRLAIESTASSCMMNLAKRCWLEGALRGNPLAQSALADELMLDGTEHNDASKRQLAAVLFALAAQQGDDAALESLGRVTQYEATLGDGLADSAVLQIAQAACSYLNR